jgi:hypothetical protein
MIPGFFWHHHAAYKCSDCKAFHDSFGKSTYEWLLYHDNQYFLLDLKEFGDEHEHFSNISQFNISSSFSGTRLKFGWKKIDSDFAYDLLTFHENEEKYESCHELQQVIKFLEKDF